MELATAALIAKTAFTFIGGQQDASNMAEYGRQQQQIAELNASRSEKEANTERALSQQEAKQYRRERDIVLSRARAVGAASSGDTTDPTALNIQQSIFERGELNALNSLFSGESAARSLEDEASITRYQGSVEHDRASKKAKSARFKSVASLFSGGLDLKERYDAGKF